MRSSTLLTLLTAAAAVSASPLGRQEITTTTTTTIISNTGSSSTTPAFPIHSSCNSTLSHQLTRAFDETVTLASVARDHLLEHGQSSPFVKKYFGPNSTTIAPLGVLSRVASAARGKMLFRCDDPDRNCATQEGWAGHWRGSNATQETVICDLSFAPGKRRWLDQVCGLGYTVKEGATNLFWATDLLHRTFHVPQVTEDAVHHYADGWDEVLGMAEGGDERSGFDSDALIYFAVDVYAYEVAEPGRGCGGYEMGN
ncbi:Prenylated Rab acceptor protein 1 [Podospora pseudopauciseta]|uniref:Prenylated Rab acceptor protein 1 n=1 Tax=Podospora pseudopauciseta TaxID=2093780 RepID=A0ABR0H942_9PEZI|nr:Prenylated Rab acceptor protein 1 [Podospora pseudopauciseta]